MQLTQIEKNGITCAIVNSSEIVITDAQSALDVLMSAKYDIGTKNIVIACGGGGIPVTRDKNGDLHGVSAVIDKDFASAKLAEVVGADYLFILTAVDHVCINFGTPEQEELKTMSSGEAEMYIRSGQFGAGSMLPKVEAAVSFVKSGWGKRAVIASLEKAPQAMRNESGTLITL